jgi:hypothetical protein
LVCARPVPNSVIVGPLLRVEGRTLVLGGNLRVVLSPGVHVPNVASGTSLTLVAVSRDGITYAERVRETPTGLFEGPPRAARPSP